MSDSNKTAHPRRAPAGAPVSLTLKERETVVAMVTAAVSHAFDQSVESFRDTPSAENFSALNESMYALPFWRGKLPEAKARLAADLYLLPVTQWIGYLRKSVQATLPTD